MEGRSWRKLDGTCLEVERRQQSFLADSQGSVNDRVLPFLLLAAARFRPRIPTIRQMLKDRPGIGVDVLRT